MPLKTPYISHLQGPLVLFFLQQYHRLNVKCLQRLIFVYFFTELFYFRVKVKTNLNIYPHKIKIRLNC